MLVSIIINNYNYARFIRSAIESALNQNYQNLEVIVVDDGSTDNSVEIIREYDGRIITVLKPNGGQASAFNAGYAKCSGDLILFLDSDDLLESDAVEQVVLSWTEGLSKLHFPLFAVAEDGHLLGELVPKEPLAAGDLSGLVLTEGDYCTSPTSGNVFPRDFLSRLMPMPEREWRDCADCYIVQLAPFYGRVAKIERPLGRYRLHEGSITSLSQNGKVLATHLQQRLRGDIRKQQMLDVFFRNNGYVAKPDVVLSTYQHYKLRLASLRLSRAGHPFEEDRLFQTGLKLVQLVWRASARPFITRMAYTGWAVVMTCFPRFFVNLTITQAFSPYSGSQFRRFLIRS